jgi:AcrR family transcriptional regulator
MPMRLCMSRNNTPKESQRELVFTADLTTAISYNVALSFVDLFMPAKKTPPSLAARRKPIQARALERRQQILDITAQLLDEVGFDDLTTILIAKRLAISVGSLYHYFPNKQSVLHALASQWIAEVELALDDIDKIAAEAGSLAEFSDSSVDRMILAYHRQQGILPLVQAIYGVPELRPLDDAHDELVINRMGKAFKHLDIQGSQIELDRLARSYLEVVHALALVVVLQKNSRAKRTLEDLKAMVNCLLARDRS